MNISEIDRSQLGETVEIGGQIAGVWDLTKGRKYQLRDETGQIPIILWDSVLEDLSGRDRLRSGCEVALSGRVNEYKGELRVMPAQAGDVQITRLADDVTLPATQLAALPQVGAGESVWAQGEITALRTFSKGVKLQISDGSGEASILLWENIYNALPIQAELQVGRRVGAFGELSHFRDEWEIVPRSLVEVVILD